MPFSLFLLVGTLTFLEEQYQSAFLELLAWKHIYRPRKLYNKVLVHNCKLACFDNDFLPVGLGKFDSWCHKLAFHATFSLVYLENDQHLANIYWVGRVINTISKTGRLLPVFQHKKQVNSWKGSNWVKFSFCWLLGVFHLKLIVGGKVKVLGV